MPWKVKSPRKSSVRISNTAAAGLSGRATAAAVRAHTLSSSTSTAANTATTGSTAAVPNAGRGRCSGQRPLPTASETTRSSGNCPADSALQHVKARPAPSI
jgi:hypothetical protein